MGKLSCFMEFFEKMREQYRNGFDYFVNPDFVLRNNLNGKQEEKGADFIEENFRGRCAPKGLAEKMAFCLGYYIRI